MSESVEILIKADDKASQQVADSAKKIDKDLRRVEQITASLESPTERYNRQLEELSALHESGAITADALAEAQEKLRGKIEEAGEAASKTTNHLKSASGTVAALANMAGGSEIAGIAKQFGNLSDKVGEFREATKEGGSGALAMKAGLIGLAATIGYSIGKVFGDIIWQTEKFEHAMAKAKEQSKALDDQLKAMQASQFSATKEDIELIRDPDEKQAAYKKLMDELEKDIDRAAAKARASQKDVDEWAEAWKITGDRKQYEIDAQEQLKADQERLQALKDQRAEIERIAGARAVENEQIRLANEAKDRSEEYLDTLRREVEYLAASREEQIKLEAARNATAEDQKEAERLLRERDAIQAKIEAQQEFERVQKQAQDEAAKASEKEREEAVKKIEHVQDLIATEKQRLELQRIEIEQGKEAARVKALTDKGVDVETAKMLAAEESALEKLQKNKQEEGKPRENLQASESRLLTRGASQNPMEETNRILTSVNRAIDTVVSIGSAQLDASQLIAENTRESVKVTVPK